MEIKLITDHPLASGSFDYIEPWGTKENNVNLAFNDKLYHLCNWKPLKILDVGCAAGGFVAQCIQDGHHAIGIDGSDFNIKNPTNGCWYEHPHNFFTCDVSKPFQLQDENGNAPNFNVVTCWETLEHLDENGVDTLLATINQYSNQNTLFIGTIACHFDKEYHQIIEQPGWWFSKLREFNWIYNQGLVEYFNCDWIRRKHKPVPISNGIITDRSQGFHFVCNKDEI